MGSQDTAVMGLESGTVIAQVTKHFVTILCKTGDKEFYLLVFTFSGIKHLTKSMLH